MNNVHFLPKIESSHFVIKNGFKKSHFCFPFEIKKEIDLLGFILNEKCIGLFGFRCLLWECGSNFCIAHIAFPNVHQGH